MESLLCVDRWVGFSAPGSGYLDDSPLKKNTIVLPLNALLHGNFAPLLMLQSIPSLLWWAVLWTPSGSGLEGLGVADHLPKPANNTNNHDDITHTPTKESLLNQRSVSPKFYLISQI